MIPLSTSRVYLFGVITNLTSEQLCKNMHLVIKRKFPELTYKNIEVKLVKKGYEIKKEVHINHLLYQKRRNFSLDVSNFIRMKLIEIFTLVPFKYTDLNFVNDGFDRRPSLGLSRVS